MIKQKLDGAGSYLPVLEKLLQFTDYKKVIEIVEGYEGCGDFSTKYFMSYPDFQLTTIQTSITHKSPNTDALYLNDDYLAKFLETRKLYDIAFIDTKIEYCYKLVQSLMKNTSIIVVHDTQSQLYCYDKVKIPLDWIYADFVFFRPWTGIFTRYKMKLRQMVADIPGVIYERFENKIYIEEI